MDTTGRRQKETRYKETLLKHIEMLNNIDEAVAFIETITDEDGQQLDFLFLHINDAFEKLFNLKKEQVIGKKLTTFFPNHKHHEHKLKSFYNKVNYLGQEVRFEKHIDALDLYFDIKLTSPEKSYIVVTFSDITKEKQLENEVRYLSLCDPLTGLFNREYFLQELSSLKENPSSSVGLFLCDIDGLRLVNETMGYDTGDLLLRTTARILKDSFHHKSIAARIGSDEFAVLIPNSYKKLIEETIRKIKKRISKFNLTHPKALLSISRGYSLRTWPVHINELIKEAKDNMRQAELCGRKSHRRAYMHALMRTLEARDIITQSHEQRMQKQIVAFASIIGLPESKQTALYLLAQFHDIGKVGIPDSILNKPGPLTLDERKEMQNHCEIGCRIAQAVPELAIISDWVLKHHEWWNGNGYPLGLKGVEIPLECRILAIVDAYDAMTSNRPYRKALSHEEALAELKRWEGTQFDPQLVAKFINSLENINAAAR